MIFFCYNGFFVCSFCVFFHQFSFLQLFFFLVPYSSRSHWSITAMHLCVNCLFCFVLFLYFSLFHFKFFFFYRSKLSKRLNYIEVMEPLLKYGSLCMVLVRGWEGCLSVGVLFFQFLSLLLLYLFLLHSFTLSFYISFVCFTVVSLFLFCLLSAYVASAP